MNEFMKSPNIMKRVTIRVLSPSYYPELSPTSRLIYLSAFAYPSDSTRTTVGNVKEQGAQNRNFDFKTSSSINQNIKFDLISKLLVLTCSLVIIMYISHPFFQNLF